jgi:hypothetical protein
LVLCFVVSLPAKNSRVSPRLWGRGVGSLLFPFLKTTSVWNCTQCSNSRLVQKYSLGPMKTTFRHCGQSSTKLVKKTAEKAPDRAYTRKMTSLFDSCREQRIHFLTLPVEILGSGGVTRSGCCGRSGQGGQLHREGRGGDLEAPVPSDGHDSPP